MPRFSVVVPAYNAEATLAETLDAVLAQTFEDWECVIVDDGSTDGTLALARAYAQRDERFRVTAQENKGTGGAYNSGVRTAFGEWVSICSADDVLLPEHLATMHAAIGRHQQADIVTCNGYFWYPDGSRALVYSAQDSRAERSWTIEETLMRCFFSVGACYRRDLFELVGGYREGVFGEDYDFWLHAMAKGATHIYIPEALCLHRVSATQKSANKTRAYESDIDSIKSLLSEGLLTESQQTTAQRAIRHRRELIADEDHPNRPTRLLRRAAGRIKSWVC